MKNIVKVQMPIFGSQEILIYSEDNSVMGTFPITKEIKKAMAGRLKKYFYYELVPDKKRKGVFVNLLTDKYCPDQNW